MPRLAVSVVLPTPPLPEQIRIVRFCALVTGLPDMPQIMAPISGQPMVEQPGFQ